MHTLMESQIEAIHTLNDLLEAQITDLLRLGYLFSDETSSRDFECKSSVFISKEEEDMLEERFLSKIMTLLGCYHGKESFFIQIVYQEGIGHISILV